MTESSPINSRLKAGERLPILPLTSVRFLAAAYVVLLHCFLWPHLTYTTTWTDRFLSNGYTAVGFFFTLSGFILAHVYLNTDRSFNSRALRTFEFLAGIALCSVQSTVVMQMAARSRNRLGWIALLGAALLFVTVIEVANRIPMLMMSNGFLLPVYAGTILGLVIVRGGLQQAMSHRWAVLLGESSYAVYLLHSPVYRFLFFFLHPTQTPGAWLLYFTLLLGGSVASFLMVERPMRKRILAWAVVRPSISLKQEMVSPR